MSTLAVVEGILREAEVPMSVREIVERAGDALPTKSKTPDTVVARDLSMDIKRNGDASLFVRTAPGRYTMRDVHLARLDAQRESDASASKSAGRSELVAKSIGDEPTPKGTKAASPAQTSPPKAVVHQPQQ